MEEFPSNSNRAPKAARPAKDEPKQIQKVVQGEVKRRRKPLGKRFSETFVGGDAQGVMSYVVLDILVPAAKDTIADAVSQGVERMIFGEARSTSRRGSHRTVSGYTPYNRMSSPMTRREEPREPLSRRARATHNFDEVILDTRVEAEAVIDQLFNLILKYEEATVADLYEMIEVSSSYTDRKWGWTDIRDADVKRVRNGYLLDLPKPEPLA